MLYSETLVQAISALFQMSIDKNYAPLQEETLALLSCLAETLKEQFQAYYAKFMPGLKEILRITPYETKTQKDLRANCIQTIGSILESVKEQPQVCKNDALEVMEVFSKLIQPGVLNEDDP